MVDIQYKKIEGDEKPYLDLNFQALNEDEATVRISVDFSGHWVSLFPDREGATEDDVRDDFAAELFARIAAVFGA